MSSSSFNQVFFVLVMLALLGAIAIPPSVTRRAQGKADVLLVPVVKPVRSIAAYVHAKFARKTPPPGEERFRTDNELAAENGVLRQQVSFLTRQLQELKLVEAERKKFGPLLDYFKPVTVIGGDGSPTRASLSLMPTGGIDTSVGTPVIYADGVVGKLVEGGRVRLVTDRDSTIAAEFARYDNGAIVTLGLPKASVRGTGGEMRVENLTVKEVEGVLRPGDIVIVSDPADYRKIVQGRPFGQVESVRPLPSKPLFAEIVVKPRMDLRTLPEVLVLRK
jgi:cell shape-determining protein MreC